MCPSPPLIKPSMEKNVPHKSWFLEYFRLRMSFSSFLRETYESTSEEKLLLAYILIYTYTAQLIYDLLQKNIFCYLFISTISYMVKYTFWTGADIGGAGPPEIFRGGQSPLRFLVKKCLQFDKSYVFPFFKKFDHLMEI